MRSQQILSLKDGGNKYIPVFPNVWQTPLFQCSLKAAVAARGTLELHERCIELVSASNLVKIA